MLPPPSRNTARVSAPPELQPVRDNKILDQASVLLDMLELRETQSAPELTPEDEQE